MRCNTGSASPPNQMGIGFCTGFGAKAALAKDTNSPWNDGEPLLHNSIIARMYSSQIAPRLLNGTLRMVNSSSIQPTPNIGTARPPLSQSRVAQSLAWMTGFCNGSMVSDDARRILDVWPASTPRATVLL